jgi:hypothetical protein
MSTAALTAFALVVPLLSGSACHAGILLPQPVDFDVNDLERQFNGDDGSAGAVPANSHSPTLPNKENGEKPERLKATLPTGNSSSSSSSSTSSAGGAPGSGIVLCLFNSTIAIADGAPLGRLAEDRGLTLPDPPGTDLLRPPRG